MRSLVEAAEAATRRQASLGYMDEEEAYRRLDDHDPEDARARLLLQFVGLGIDLEGLADVAVDVATQFMGDTAKIIAAGIPVTPEAILASIWQHGVLTGALAQEPQREDFGGEGTR